MIARDKFDLNQLYPFSVFQMKWDGKVYAMMQHTDINIMWYNTDLLRQTGLDPSNLPKTWDDLEQLALKGIKKSGADVVGIEEGGGEIPQIAHALGWRYYDVRMQIVSRLPLVDPVEENVSGFEPALPAEYNLRALPASLDEALKELRRPKSQPTAGVRAGILKNSRTRAFTTSPPWVIMVSRTISSCRFTTRVRRQPPSTSRRSGCFLPMLRTKEYLRSRWGAMTCKSLLEIAIIDGPCRAPCRKTVY